MNIVLSEHTLDSNISVKTRQEVMQSHRAPVAFIIKCTINIRGHSLIRTEFLFLSLQPK